MRRSAVIRLNGCQGERIAQLKLRPYPPSRRSHIASAGTAHEPDEPTNLDEPHELYELYEPYELQAFTATVPLSSATQPGHPG